ncbi:MAG: S8 family peptidase [Candidatus Methanoperedens sp.]|nr:S8 family peptidase [Candidatus Methanoperedens sp.]MCZ7371819.1 S8 family peptidase [Candidatus Methanoperedens sp.]
MKISTVYNKIAIFIIISLVLGTGLAGAKLGTDSTRIVITLDSQTVKDNVIKAVQDNGGTFVRETLDNKLIFYIPTASLNNQISILTIPGAAYIEEDAQIQIPTPIIEVAGPGENIQLTPNDPLYPNQWGMRMIEANKMWDTPKGKGDSRLIVAVIDTGVDYTHEDLAAVNKTLGYDFVNNDNDPMDDMGHGTHVAGIIAATMNNKKGVVGVAPNVTVMPVKVCNAYGSCYTSDIADGIRWAVDHGAKILSISLGGPSPDQQTSDATKYAVLTKGALVIAAAGNSGLEQPSYPGAYPWVLAVGALDSTGKRASYSQYGNFLDLMAPGSNIISTVPKGACELCDPSGYEYLSGTSMATPHASGVAALYWSYNLSFTNKQVGIMLLKFADDLGTPGWDKYYGYGRVDAYPQDG